LRQAKLAFPSVYLLVGVNSDEQVRANKARGIMTHAERCVCPLHSMKSNLTPDRLEAARHCRWVDEIVADAPWVIDQAFIDRYQIDYVAHDEDPYVSSGHEDVYAFVKGLGAPLSFPFIRPYAHGVQANSSPHGGRPASRPRSSSSVSLVGTGSARLTTSSRRWCVCSSSSLPLSYFFFFPSSDIHSRC
jgi:glycerol-3-phosphate cytidylyltransferase-like family protein